MISASLDSMESNPWESTTNNNDNVSISGIVLPDLDDVDVCLT